MQFILALRHSRIILQHAVTLITLMLVGFLTQFIAFRKDTRHRSLLAGNPMACITVIFGRRHFRDCKFFYLICSSLLIFFRLQVGQEVAPLFVVKGVIVLSFILHITVHSFWQAIFFCNTNLIIRSLFVSDSPICLVILILLIWRWI